MKFFAILFCVGFTHAFVVRRDADGVGYGAVSPATVSSPVCNSVPQKVCKDRSIETPRQVCHTEHDEIVDITVTEHCETTITTRCEQVSSQSRYTQALVGADSRVVSTGLVASPEVTVSQGASSGGVISGYSGISTGAISGYSAATSGALAGYGTANIGAVGGTGGFIGTGSNLGYSTGYGKRDADGYGHGAAGPVSTSAPVCSSVPVRTCNKVPVNTPRKVARTVCKTVVDVKIIKDCTDTVSTTCTQQSVQQSHSSNVVGAESKFGPAAVVANHGTVAVGSGYTGGAVVRGASQIIGGYAGGASVGPVIGGYTGEVTGSIGAATGFAGYAAGYTGGVVIGAV